MSNYDAIDMKWTWNGDYSISRDGDIADTSDDALQSLLQDIHTVSASQLGDWKLYNNLGASLDDFLGESNSKETGRAIQDRLKVAITSAGLVLDQDLSIKVIPVHLHKVLIIVKINASSTSYNKLTPGQKLVTSLVFDFAEQQIFFLDKKPIITAGNF